MSWMRRNLAVAINAACLGLVMVVGWQVNDLRSHHLVVLEEYIMQTVTTKWTSGGSEYEVTTARKDNETVAAWRARHMEAVVEFQEEKPPD